MADATIMSKASERPIARTTLGVLIRAPFLILVDAAESRRRRGVIVCHAGWQDNLNRPDMTREILETIDLLSRRHQITALDDFIESCRSFAEEEILNIAVLGKFKTGKS